MTGLHSSALGLPAQLGEGRRRVHPGRKNEPIDLYEAGMGGHTYRIPALTVAPDGGLLAFCERRRYGHTDSGEIDIVVRRSIDLGATWADPETVWADAGNTCGNPCPVVDESTGTIWLLATWNLGSDTESTIVRSNSADVRHPYVLGSTDNGVAWSDPRCLSQSARHPNWLWYATGPGNGIQLRTGRHRGRLIVPANHSVPTAQIADDLHHRSHVLISDDGGLSWSIGGIQPPRTNESAVAERGDGSIIQAMRNAFDGNRRALSISSDGGRSFGEPWLATELDTPPCQASLLRLDDDTLLFSSPRGPDRSHMTIWASDDGGATWPASHLIDAGPVGYSSLTPLPDRSIGLLYERGDGAAIRFSRHTYVPSPRDRASPRW